MNRRAAATLAGLLLLLAAAIALRLLAGRDESGPVLSLEFIDLRLMRVGAGVVVGVTLGVAGVFLQALLRNPLASPDVLGLASGSGLGVMVVAYAAYRSAGIIGAESQPGLGMGAAAVVGALAALGAVWALGQRRGMLDPVTLVLVGVAVAMACSAASQLVRHLLPDQGLAAGRLLLGSLRDPGGAELAVTGGVATVGLGAGLFLARAMDAASLGEDEARSVGVPLAWLRTALFVVSGVLTAASVVLAGPVGFVGLVCPHVVRLMAGPRHGVLVVGTAMAGATLVVLCDAVVRLVDLGGGQMPLGVVTSLIGAPVLVWLLRRNFGRRA